MPTRADSFVLSATSHGYGKRTPLAEYPRHKRGGQGVIGIQTSKRNGPVVGADLVREDDEVMLITTAGTLIPHARRARFLVVSRNTQGAAHRDRAERKTGALKGGGIGRGISGRKPFATAWLPLKRLGTITFSSLFIRSLRKPGLPSIRALTIEQTKIY